MANLYKLFKSIVPDAPLLVGRAVGKDSIQVFIQLPGGAMVSVRGDAQIGKNYFIRDDVIEGEAPDLTAITIDV